MSVVHIRFGESYDLTGFNPELRMLTAGFGWETYEDCRPFDLEAYVCMTGPDGKVEKSQNLVSAKNLQDPADSVRFCGFNYNSDDEAFSIELDKVPGDVEAIHFVLSTREAGKDAPTFSDVSYAYFHLVIDGDKDRQVWYEPGLGDTSETAIAVGVLYRHNGGWMFGAVRTGFTGGPADLHEHFGPATQWETFSVDA